MPVTSVQKLSEQIQLWNRQIEKGEMQSVFGDLTDFNMAELPDTLRASFANIARRVGNIEFALKAIQPLFRSTGQESSNSVDAIIEYGHCLVHFDQEHEALHLLRNVATSKYPEIHMLRASCFFKRWQYSDALNDLKSYIDHPETNDYQKAIGQINRIACLVFEAQFSQAERSLKRLIPELKSQQWNRLLVNAYELCGQIASEHQEWSATSTWLEKQKDLIQDYRELEGLYSQNLQCLVETYQTQSSAPLLAFQETARKQRNWEIVRYSDYQLARYSNDNELWQRVYLGTPYPSFRKKLIAENPNLRNFAHFPSPKNTYWDIETGLYHDGNQVITPFKQGQILHRTLQALTADMYRPSSTSSLFAFVYPHSIFDGDHSRNRVHQIIGRLRTAIRTHNLPFELNEDSGHYTIKSSNDSSIKKTLSELKNSIDFCKEALSHQFQNGSFGAREAASVLEKSPRYTIHILNELIASGKVKKSGVGRSTRYQFM